MTFNIDVNGILNVSAKDKATGKESKTTVEKSGGLSKDEVEKMKREAELNAADDKKRREVIDLKNQGESLAYQVEKTLQENGAKVSGTTRGEVESAIGQLRDNLKGEDGTAIKRAMDNLQAAAGKLQAEVAQGGTAGGGGPAPEAQSDRATGGGAGKKGRRRDRRRVRGQELTATTHPRKQAGRPPGGRPVFVSRSRVGPVQRSDGRCRPLSVG